MAKKKWTAAQRATYWKRMYLRCQEKYNTLDREHRSLLREMKSWY